MRIALTLALVCAPLAGLAQDCPAAPDHSERFDTLIANLRAAPDAAAASVHADAMWRLWLDAPDDRAQEILDRGIALRESYAFLEARDTLDALVEYCPDYAEGYNQRAFASFLRQDYDAALHDLDRALEINPRHVAALSGRALTLMGLGRDAEAQADLRAALDLNPWLSERALLTGQDI